ncbi:mitogen-activated protein kinase kinase kinase 21-like [Amphiura filiformis]|uniref:mitogen-activated protein kinase kinase kinase 21-like n=1 Tax=Amphiura filiformis TaxID=82378 RepID=UPI003B227DB8
MSEETMESKIDFGDLQFHESLGEGGFGSVNRVTFKTPYNGYTEAAAKSVIDFRKEEVEILAKLSHPHVVNLIGFYQNGPVKIIFLEYATGGSLHGYLSDESKPLPEDLKRKWICESALGIQYLHANKCLHRDIKANNCLLFEDNILKLCDFGFARETDHSVTMSSQKGTYQYMAPELINTSDTNLAVYSRYADIYAYGMLVLEICTRKRPFHGMEYAYVVFQVGEGKLQPRIPRDCPTDLAVLMRQCWHLNPRKRPSIDIVLEVMESMQGLSNETSSHQSPSSRSRVGYQDEAVLTTQPLQDSMKAKRIACCPNGDVVIGALSKVYILSGESNQTARVTCIIQVTPTIWSIAVSPQGHIITVDGSRKVKVFDKRGEVLHDISTLMGDEDLRSQVEPTCIAVDKEGRILVADSWKDVLTVHSFPGGEVMSKIKRRIHSIHSTIAVNSRSQILHHFRSTGSVYSQVAAIDYSGHEVFSFIPKIDEELTTGKKVRPRGIVCDAYDNIYIIVKVVVGFVSFENTGHLHKYSPTGGFLGCLAKGLYKPCGLAITTDGSALKIADHNSILTYNL